jgi:hypothetical protein
VAYATKSRAEQGLPPKVTDPVALYALAAIVARAKANQAP